jgi:hypothetical protein
VWEERRGRGRSGSAAVENCVWQREYETDIGEAHTLWE